MNRRIDNPIKALIRRLGGDCEVGRALKRRPSAIRNWVRDGYIPPRHHEAIIELAKEKGVEFDARILDPDSYVRG